MYFSWIRRKDHPIKPEIHFYQSTNGNNYVQPHVKVNDESTSLIPFTLLVEYAKYISDIHYFCKENNFLSNKNNYKNSMSLKNPINLKNALTLYGNGLNIHLGINWIKNSDLETITSQGILLNLPGDPIIRDAQIVANSTYTYTQIFPILSKEEVNCFKWFLSSKDLNYESKMLLEHFDGIEGFNNYAEEVKEFIMDCYKNKGNEIIFKFWYNKT